MTTIRFAGPQDAGLIADMSRQTFYDSFFEQNSKENMQKFLREQFGRDKLVKEVGAPNNIFLIAEDDRLAVGYARMREKNNPPELNGVSAIEIARIYAVQNAIGKGVGRALMQTCIDIAKARGYSTAWLGVWEHNQRAIQFYERWGFERFSTQPFRLGDDVQTDWLMKKELI